jgi:HEAT repeat protein
LAELTVRQAALRELVARLLSGAAENPEAEMEKLCHYFKPDDVGLVWELLSTRPTIAAAGLLAGYLSEIATSDALDKLAVMGRGELAAMREEAIAAVHRLQPEDRVRVWIRMLVSSYEDTLKAAAEGLGGMRARPAVIPLMRILEGNAAEDVRAAAASALGRIGDPRALSALEKTLLEGEGEPSAQASWAIGQFARRVSRGFIRKCMASPSEGVRRAVYTALARRGGAAADRHLGDALKAEVLPTIKSHILASLRTIDSPQLLRTLVDLGASHGDGNTAMFARSALRRMRSPRILGWLLRWVDGSLTVPVREEILRTVCFYPLDRRVHLLYRRILESPADERAKLIVIEKAGYLHTPELDAKLLELACGTSRFAYAAAAAVLHHVDRDRWDLLRQMLFLPEREHGPVVQLALRFMARIPAGEKIPDEIIYSAERLAEEGRKHTRCLALRALTRHAPKVNMRVFRRSAGDGDPAVFQTAMNSILDWINNDPQALQIFFNTAGPDRMPMRSMPALIRRIDWNDHRFDVAAHWLLSQAHRGSDRSRSEAAAVLRLLIRTRPGKFVEYFTREKFEDRRARLLMRLCVRTPLADSPGLDPAPFIRLYRYASDETRVEVLRFIAASKIRTPELETLVFDAIASGGSEDLARTARQIARRWMTAAQPQEAVHG